MVKSVKSSSGVQASNIDDISMGFDKKMAALATSWKSGSGAQASKKCDFSKGFNEKMIGLNGLARL